MAAMVIRNMRALGEPEAIDIVVRDGVIDAIGSGAGVGVNGAETIEGEGRLMYPGLVDAHTHMDKTLMGLGWYRNDVGPTLFNMIEN